MYVHKNRIVVVCSLKVPYLGHSATKDRFTFHTSQLQLQIKVGCQLKVQFILRFERSEKRAWREGAI